MTPTWTNRQGIDEAIATIVREDAYELVGDISVTGLLRPPQIALLETQHQDEITEDVSDARYKFFGRMAHEVLSKARVQGSIAEHLLTIEVNGWKISGHFDVWYEDRTLKDFKYTSVWSYIFGRREWEEQVNCYGYMAEQSGIKVDGLAIAAMFYDWKKRDVANNRDYPPAWAVDIPVAKWPSDFTQRFLEERVTLHQNARINEVAPPCTEEERWARPDQWAVKKPGAKRATRVFDSNFKASDFASIKPGYYEVEFRRGQSRRCESFCSVLPWCPQAKALGVISNA